MQIRTKLSLYFTISTAILLLCVFILINILFDKHVSGDFFTSLKERAIVAAQVYLEADEISDSSLASFKTKYLKTLSHESIRFYDTQNNPAFVEQKTVFDDIKFIERVRKEKYVEAEDKGIETVGISYEDNQGSYVIIVSATNKQGKKSIASLLRTTIIIYLLVLLVLFFGGRWFAKKALEQVQKINKQIQKITAEDLHLRLDEGNGKDEISELAINFNSLLQRLESAFEMQKTFVANATHELRTPLTSIIGEIEVAAAQQRSNEEYRQLLTSVLADAEKLENIIDGLLSLANAENMIATQQIEEVRIDELLWDLQGLYKKTSNGQMLNIELRNLPLNENELCIKANKHLLLIAINNVIKNGFKFSNNQPVNCTLESSGGIISITIKDNGIGISKEAIGNLFKPFTRSENSRGYEGMGIGLFITKKIIDQYHGAINVVSENNHGTEVNISFNKKPGF